MQRRTSKTAPRAALAGAALAGLVGITGAAATGNVPLGLIALGASAAGVSIGMSRMHASQCERYRRTHEPLAGPRQGANVG